MTKKKTWEGLLLMVLGKFPPNELPPGRFPPTLTLIQGDICLEGNLLGGDFTGDNFPVTSTNNKHLL